MENSLRRYNQLSPVVYCELDGALVLVDGFKRLRAAQRMGWNQPLQARRLELDEQGAKAAIFNLNRIHSKLNELEESWVIYALIHEDGLSQTEVATLLGSQQYHSIGTTIVRRFAQIGLWNWRPENLFAGKKISHLLDQAVLVKHT